LTEYVGALYERTRVDKGGLKIGFDWIIYQLGLAKDWIPVRLPFLREPTRKAAKTKTEAEFGVDLAFLLPSKQDLSIFVLKDEHLTYQNWKKKKHSFETDLRMAATVDPRQQGYPFVRSVTVTLAYNKDQDNDGLRAYKQLVNSLPSKVGDDVRLRFDRWNLDRIVQEVKTHLTPDLLPQHVAGPFRYVCSLVTDFPYGTYEWEKFLIPKWRKFLASALESPIDERKLRLIPVALMILKNYGTDAQNPYPGWLDLVEWTMLALWSASKNLPQRGTKRLSNILLRSISKTKKRLTHI